MFYWGKRLNILSPDGGESWSAVWVVTPSGGDEIAKAAPGVGRRLVVLSAQWINIASAQALIAYKDGVGGAAFARYQPGGVRRGNYRWRGSPRYLSDNTPLVVRHEGFGLGVNEHYVNFQGMILG